MLFGGWPSLWIFVMSLCFPTRCFPILLTWSRWIFVMSRCFPYLTWLRSIFVMSFGDWPSLWIFVRSLCFPSHLTWSRSIFVMSCCKSAALAVFARYPDEITFSLNKMHRTMSTWRTSSSLLLMLLSDQKDQISSFICPSFDVDMRPGPKQSKTVPI